jgi:hypothetical protein
LKARPASVGGREKIRVAKSVMLHPEANTAKLTRPSGSGNLDQDLKRHLFTDFALFFQSKVYQG